MKMAFSKCKFLSVEQQKIILLMYENGGSINYKAQDVYKNERSFNAAMLQLVRVKACKLGDESGFYNNFRLTNAGRFLCKANIIPLERE